MKERRVLNQNKIPGSEILTRPEEISELSKYLGEKRKQLEDSLKADTTLLGVPGKTTGKIPTVSSLEESYERLRDDRPPIARLPQDMNRIGGLEKKIVDGLEKKIESLSGVEIGAEKLSNLLTLLSDSRDIRLIVNKIRLGIDQPQEKELSEIIERLGITWAEMMVVSEAIKIITSEHPEVQNLSEYIEHLGDTNRELLFLRTSEKLKVTHPEINLVTTPIERLYINREDPKIKNLTADIDIPGEQKQNTLSTTKEELNNTAEELKDLKNSLIGLGIDWKNLEILFTSVRMISSTNPEVTELPGNTKDLPKDPREKDDHDLDLDSTFVHTPVDERNDRIEIELLDRSESPTLRPQEIDLLPTNKETLDKRIQHETALESFKDTIEDSRETILDNFKDTIEDSRENSLVDYKDRLEDNRKTVLENFKDTIEDNRENSLTDYKDTIEDNRENSLADYKDTIEDSREIILDNFKDTIDDSRENSLVDYKDTIEDNRENNLVNFKDTIEDNRENSLTDYKDTIEDNRENSLVDYKDTLEDNREATLENFKDTIEDSRENILENFKDKLEDSRETVLDNFKDKLEDNRENSLTDYKDKLEDSRENSLVDYKDTIEDNRENSLVDYKDTIEDSRETILGNFKDKLEDNRENSLVDYKDTIEDTRETTLDNFKDTIEDNRENTLENFKDTIEDNRENSLTDYKDTIEDNRENSLVDYKDTLEDNRETVLDNFKDTIEDSRENSLVDYKDTIEDNRENNLVNFKDTLEDNREITLTDFLDSITDSRETTLENTRIDIEKPEDRELYDTLLAAPDSESENYWDSKSEGNELYDVSITLPDSVPENKLEKPITKIPGETSDIPLETLVKDLPDSETDPISLLSQTIIKRADEKNEETIWNPEEGDENPLLKKIESLENEVEDLVGEKLPDETIELGESVGEDYWDPSSDESKLSNTISSENKINDTVENKSRDKLPSKLIELGESVGEDYWDPQEKDNSLPSTDPLSPEVETEDLVGEELPEDKVSMGSTGMKTYWDPSSDESKLPENKVKPSSEPKPVTKLNDGLKKLEGEIEEIEELYDSSLSPTPDESTDFWGGADGGEELYDTLLSAPESQNSTLRKQVLSAIDSNNSDDEVFKRMMKLFKESEDKTEWEKKLESIMSGYLSDSVLTPERAAEYENKLNEMTTISRLGFEEDSKMIEGKMKGDKENIPEYKLTKNGSVLDALNMNNYVRFAAEKVLGKLHGSARRILLQETLAMLVLAREQLEKVTKANRDRLPGGDMGLLTDLMQGGVKGAVSGAVGAATKAVGQLLSGASGVDHTNPMNRPETNIAGQKKEKGVGITHYEVANDRPGQETKRGVVGALKSLVKSVTGIGGGKQESYKDKYFSAPAFTGITLMDLCSYTIPSSLDDLRNVLESSPYITTPTKFGTVTKGLYETYSLDTNNYWEVVIEPFCHDKLNGGWSFLPAIQEINVENLVDHRITTAYNYWVPINSFELQKSKLTTKSLQLYDGEIIYPIGAEYTNELRITVVDDQLKSWRRYFEKCMEVAVYNSLPHDGNYYSGTNFIPTAVDKKNICIALYKNITFEIRIYIMNPQYHTLRKFDLLCVLKDFSEEYAGEIDGAGTDLNVSFSIVGENPEQNPYADKIRDNAWEAADKFEKTISDTYENNSKSSSLIKLL